MSGPRSRRWRITFLSAAGIPVQWPLPTAEQRRRLRAWQIVDTP